jgi:hypothetical protein
VSDPDQASDEAGAGAACAHPQRIDGVCTTCGHCLHELVLNGACYYCGGTDLDPVALSPKPAEQIVPASRLVRGKRDPGGSPGA